MLFLVPFYSLASDFGAFKSSSIAIISTLQAQGINKVGDLDLNLLSQEISSTKWSSVKDKFLLGSGTSRTTSVYLVKEKHVIVNELSLNLMSQDTFPQASLHEVLGANGYDDEHYQISLSLYAISKNPKTSIKAFENNLKNLKPRRTDNTIYKSVDGGTSVGGGGDGTTIEFKTLLLDALIQDPELSSEQNVLAIVNAEVEPDWTQSFQQPLKIGKSETGIYTIVLPSFSWVLLARVPNQSESFKSHLVQTALKHIFGNKP